MFIAETELRNFIVDTGLVSKKDMAEAEKEASARKTSLGEVLVNQGKLSHDDVRKARARISGIPFVNLRELDVDPEALRLIPEPLSRKHNVVAFKKSAAGIEVAALDTADLHAVAFVGKGIGAKILPRLTDADSMKSAILKYQRSLKAEFGSLIKRETKAAHVVDALLKHALVQNASDIHVEPGEKDALIRYRIDGMLHDAMILPKAAGASIVARIKGLAGLSAEENRFPQEGKFKAEMSGESISLRASIVPTFRGEKAVIYLFRDNPSGFALEQLGLHGEALERVRAAIKSTGGMVLAVGPHGSGISTTLYSLLGILNTPKVNVSTVENPVLSAMPRVNQVNVRPEIGFSFAEGLRSVIRQNSDVIMVEEIGDAETASLAVGASLAGRLVLSSLPAKSASFAAARLADMKIEPFPLASSLLLVIGQRLVRKLSRSKERKPLSRAELGALGKVVDLDRMLAMLKAESVIGPKDGWSQVMFGSPKASSANGGYEGVIGIQEVLRASSTIQALIAKGATPAEIEARAKKEGMATLLEDGVFKAAQGLTTIEEVLRVLSE